MNSHLTPGPGWNRHGGRRATIPAMSVEPADLTAGGSTYVVRHATAADVPAIVSLLAADQIGAARDGPGEDRRGAVTRDSAGDERHRQPRHAEGCPPPEAGVDDVGGLPDGPEQHPDRHSEQAGDDHPTHAGHGGTTM